MLAVERTELTVQEKADLFDEVIEEVARGVGPGDVIPDSILRVGVLLAERSGLRLDPRYVPRI